MLLCQGETVIVCIKQYFGRLCKAELDSSGCTCGSTLHHFFAIVGLSEDQSSAPGTRGPLDMVEIPSHFFEHFLLDDECLGLCSGHYTTGDAMPPGVREAVKRSLDFMPALEMNDSVHVPLLSPLPRMWKHVTVTYIKQPFTLCLQRR